MNKLRAINRNGTKEDIEVLAAKVRLERQTKCSKAINDVLTEHDCEMAIVLQIGTQSVPLNQIVALPGAIMIQSKPK